MIRGIHTYTVCSKANKARIYLENISLMDANFLPGTPIEVAFEAGREIVLRRTTEENADIHIISRRKKNRVVPVIDFTQGVETLFEYREKIRVEVRDGEIRISHLQTFASIEVSEDGQPKVSHTEKFTVFEVPSGAGLAGFAFEHTGLYSVIGAADWDEAALESVRFNHRNAILYHGNMFDLNQRDIPKSDVFLLTPDCTSYSRYGKRNFVCSASAPMVHHGIRMISSQLPPVVVVENVVEFGQSIWYHHYKKLMDRLGYSIFDDILQAWEFGTIATRPRFISVAVPKGFTFEFPKPCLNNGQRDKVKKHVIEIENRDWVSKTQNRSFAYYFGRHKEIHDGRGNNFGISDRAFVSLNDTKMPAFIAGYGSYKSQGPYLQHPTDPDLLSRFTPEEMLSIMGFPEYQLPSWHSMTTKYRLVGQSVCGRMFRALATSIATVLMEIRLAAKNAVKVVKKTTKRMTNSNCDQLAISF